MHSSFRFVPFYAMPKMMKTLENSFDQTAAFLDRVGYEVRNEYDACDRLLVQTFYGSHQKLLKNAEHSFPAQRSAQTGVVAWKKSREVC